MFDSGRKRMKGGKRLRAGRKPVHIDLEQVEKLAAIQCTEAEIASVIGVSERTIERRKQQPDFAEAMARGKARGRVSLRRSLWALAQKGNPAGNIFLEVVLRHVGELPLNVILAALRRSIAVHR